MGQHYSDIDVMSTPFDSLSFADDPSDSFLESTGEGIEFRTRSAGPPQLDRLTEEMIPDSGGFPSSS